MRKVRSGYRYYSPELGRWPSRDPIGERGGRNLYCFIHNTPINGYDPLGENARVRMGDKFPNYHVQICVDIYDEEGNKSGEKCYGFTAIPVGFWQKASWRVGCPCQGYAGEEDAITGKILEMDYGAELSPETEKKFDEIIKEVIEAETGIQTYKKWSFSCIDWVLHVMDKIEEKIKEMEDELEGDETPAPPSP